MCAASGVSGCSARGKWANNTAAVKEQHGASDGQSGSEPRTRIIYRTPERQAGAAPSAEAADSGEAVLQAQTVSPAKAAAMSAAYSYPPGQTGGGRSSPPVETLTVEQEERITQRVLEDINYNRMADEVLDRVERRLRAERRKFGR